MFSLELLIDKTFTPHTISFIFTMILDNAKLVAR